MQLEYMEKYQEKNLMIFHMKKWMRYNYLPIKSQKMKYLKLIFFEYLPNNKKKNRNRKDSDSIKLNLEYDNEEENSDIDEENDKYKEINKLKQQLENEKLKIKKLIKRIIELENEINEEE